MQSRLPRERAFTFNTKHSACFLKHIAEVVYRYANAVSGFKVDLEHLLRLSPFVINEDFDFKGPDLEKIQSTSLEGMRKHLLSGPTLKLSFIHQPRKCAALKSGAKLTPTTGIGMVSGVRDESPDSGATLGTVDLDN